MKKNILYRSIALFILFFLLITSLGCYVLDVMYDRNPGVALFLSFIIGAAGASIDEAVDGQEAIDKMQETQYDLILTDILMPRTDGYGVLKYAKLNQNSTPIIALSSTFTEYDIKGLKKQGFDYVIPKPFDNKKVKETVEEALTPKS